MNAVFRFSLLAVAGMLVLSTSGCYESSVTPSPSPLPAATNVLDESPEEFLGE